MSKIVQEFTVFGLLKILLVLSILAGAMIRNSTSANADALPDRYSGVSITDATVRAGSSGGSSELRFRLVNEGTEPLTLLGVTSGYITESRILARTGHETSEYLGSINIPVEETLDFRSFHIKMELTGLNRNFVPGQIVTLKLAMVHGEIPINAHVH